MKIRGFSITDIWIKTIIILILYSGAVILDEFVLSREPDANFFSFHLLVAIFGIIYIGCRSSKQFKINNYTAKLLSQKTCELTAVMNNLPDIAWIKNKESRYTMVNKKFSDECGTIIDKVIGKTPFEIWPREAAEKFVENDQLVLIDGKTIQKEQSIPDLNSVYGWIEIIKSPVHDDKKTITGITGIARDITLCKNAEYECRQLESQLRQSQKMEAIGTLAGGIAHDFNNILAAMMGYAEISQMEIPTDSTIYHRLERILKAGHRGKDLVNQILAFSRQHEQEKKPVKLSLIMEEAIKLLRPLIPSSVEILAKYDGGSNIIFADPTQMHQVLINLCSNSSYAMRDNGGKLNVCVEDINFESDDINALTGLNPGPYVRLTVSDTGHGMDPKIKDRIFEPFFTTKKPGDGTGMGLSVVHGIVKSLGGAIIVESQPGKGSTFKIYIPGFEGDIIELSTEAPLFSVGNERILLVDDEEFIADMAREMLGSLGYQVVSLTNSLEALEIFQRDNKAFNLIITDQTMPNMTGEELARKVMQIRSDIPIILCTGFSETVSPERARALGIKEYIMKPFIKREMACAIRRVLDGEKNN